MTPVRLRVPATMPEALGACTLGVVPAAVLWVPLTELAGRHVTCLVRSRTGVPCPMCGGVTAVRALLAGDLAGAAASNPFAALLVVVSAALLALWLGRCAGVAPPPASWSLGRSRAAGALLVAALVASWWVQLVRFEMIG